MQENDKHEIISRISWKINDDSSFVLIGTQDKDDCTIIRDREMYDLVRKKSRKYKIGFNIVNYKYTSDEIDTDIKKGLIIYGIPKDEALDIAKRLNQEMILWKDSEVINLIFLDDRENLVFENCSDIMHIGYHSGTSVFEGTVRYPVRNTDFIEQEYFAFITK